MGTARIAATPRAGTRTAAQAAAASALATIEKDTVSIHFVRSAVRGLSPPACHEVMQAAGIPEELLGMSQARVPAEHFSALWLAVARLRDDEFFGLDRRRMKVGSFALLARLALHSGTLEQAIKLTLRAFHTFLDDVSAELEVTPKEAVVKVRNRIEDPESRRFADETFLVLLHGLMCWLVGRRIPLNEAAFAWPRHPHVAEYAVVFCETVHFDAPHTEVRFDARLLSIPVLQNERSLQAFLRDAPQSVFLKYKNDDSWTLRLRRRLREYIGRADWPLLEELAAEWHVGTTTLRRRLEAEGTSYQGLKDAVRRDAAIQHLCTTTMSIADISHLLGFQEPSAFHRAFKKWTGAQPGEYRMRQSATGPGPAGGPAATDD